MKNNLIKISRDITNFFTDIYVYDTEELIPNVARIGEKGSDDKKEKYNVVFFKDLETQEMLMFSVSQDSELLSKDIKSKNTYLINQMQDFVRIKFEIFNDYYKGVFDRYDLEDLLKIEFSPIHKSQKFLCNNYYRNEESFELR